jgi:hypothetical protein
VPRAPIVSTRAEYRPRRFHAGGSIRCRGTAACVPQGRRLMSRLQGPDCSWPSVVRKHAKHRVAGPQASCGGRHLAELQVQSGASAGLRATRK